MTNENFYGFVKYVARTFTIGGHEETLANIEKNIAKINKNAFVRYALLDGNGAVYLINTDRNTAARIAEKIKGLEGIADSELCDSAMDAARKVIGG